MNKIFISLFALGSLQAVTVLPPQTSLGGEIGRSLGEGLSRGFDQALRDRSQQKEDPSSRQEYSNILKLLESEKAEAEREWNRDFIEDISKLNTVERINNILPIKNINSFAKEHPAVQCVAAQLIMQKNLPSELSELASKCIPQNLSDDPINSECFAIDLLIDAANKKNYTPAKKLLCSYCQDKNQISEKLHWLHSAAEDGAAAAMRELARHYASGEGVPRNPTEAYKWTALAEARGDKQAKIIMEFATNSRVISSSSEFSEGLKLAKDWEKKHQKLFIHP